MITKKNVELKKHVSTIHCANSLSLLQRKIANALLYHAYDELLTRDEYQISIKELSALICYDSHDYKTLKRSLVDLLSTVLEWNIIEEGLPESEGEWNASSIIADASIKGPLCTYSYSNRMKQLLYMPAVYGRLNMRIQSQFKSSYGLALYENVVRYQNLQQTPWFEMPVFRKLMGVNDNKYEIFRDFKRRVLDKAVNEVNDLAELSITVDVKRALRAVVAVRFLIKKKDNVRMQEASEGCSDQLGHRLGHNFGLTSLQIKKIRQNYSDNYILDKIKMIEASPSYLAGKIVNLAKYLLKALEEDFQMAISSKVQLLTKESTSALQQKQEEMKKKNYQQYLEKHFELNWKKLIPQQQEELEAAFAKHIHDSNVDILQHLYKKEKLKNKMIEMEFRNFVKKYYSEFFSNQKTFSEYCQS